MKEERQQEESLVVSVPLSSATTVPGIQMPTNSNSNNINTSNSSTVSTIVTNQAQMQAASPATMSVTSSSLLPSSHGSLYQHLTNNQRASPLVVPVGSAALVHDSHSSSNNNHTSVLQNINSGGVISSAASFHGPNLLNETSPAAMLKVQYEKQPISRVHAIQQEGAQTGRRSRYVNLKTRFLLFCCCVVVRLSFSHQSRILLCFKYLPYMLFRSLLLMFYLTLNLTNHQIINYCDL